MAHIAIDDFIEQEKTVVRVAQLLGVSETQVRRYRKKGAIIFESGGGFKVYLPAVKRSESV